MSLAVAMMKIGRRWSCIQVSIVPKIRCERPPSAESALAEAKAFSISSIQKTTGDIASACARASRSRASVSPTNF